MTITLNGQTYIIPSNKYGELIGWLNTNAVSTKNVLTSEQIQDPRQQLLFEN